MLRLYVFNKKGDEQPIITYVGNIAFKVYKGKLYVFGAGNTCDYYDCAELEQRNDNRWYAYVEV